MTARSNATKPAISGLLIRVRGTVQGVGFRPNVWRLAREFGVTGQVSNDGEGVLIEAYAPEIALSRFIEVMQNSPPPLARIDLVERTIIENALIPETFEISKSENGSARTNVSADAATCGACLADVLCVSNRRYRYPFTNCTNCGPRLSIVKGIPYDRPNTSMSIFPLCSDCLIEYEDPSDRRFHAQPNACSACGPRTWLEPLDKPVLASQGFGGLDDIDAACMLLQRGEIVAIKAIGGFQLAVDATNEEAVNRLRMRKQRDHKPFALMARDLTIIQRYCRVDGPAALLLQSPPSPIVILPTDGVDKVAASVAPGQRTLGFMLPYTPLHHLLLRRMDNPIVCTSGNRSEEPQCVENAEANERLGEIADHVLFHDREIVNRLDDSVVRIVLGKQSILRRARGYAPQPLALPAGFEAAAELIALGGELKNTFCLITDGKAILSQHIGDLEEVRTYADYRKNLELYQNLFCHQPKTVVVDLHPEYLSSKYGRLQAAERSLNLIEVQHHHAHIAACLAENGWSLHAGQVLGVALDGLGFGTDGCLWGGEFLRADYHGFERWGTFKPVALLGGTQAMREPWRNTYAHVMAAMGWPRYRFAYEQLALTRFFESKPLQTLNAILKTGVNSPLSSSCGRLFDAVAAAVDICRESVTYEGQAAIELEAAVDLHALADEGQSSSYPFHIIEPHGLGVPYVEPLPMWHALLADLTLETPSGIIAARFHKGLARVIADMVDKLCWRNGKRWLDTVALSGGVFQNRILLELVHMHLEALGYQVLTHGTIPANDGGLSLGQAAIGAATQLKAKGA